MNAEQFNARFDYIVNECRDMLCKKAAHYTDDNDRLHNFTTAQKLQGVTLKQSIIGMMAKHTVSVYDLVRKDAAGEVIPMDMWQEKLIDNINYLIILWAAICDDDFAETPDIYDKMAEETVPPLYREVRRTAQKGEWIKVLSGDEPTHGTILKVYDITISGVCGLHNTGKTYYVSNDCYVVLEGYEGGKEMNDKLLPCPCCGGEAEVCIKKYKDDMYGKFKTYRYKCLKCGLSTDVYGIKEAAIAAWNKRADAPKGQVE